MVKTKQNAKQQITKERLLEALIAGSTMCVAAEKAGVSRTTAYKYLQDPSFLREIERRRADIWRAGRDELRGLYKKSLAVVKRAIDSNDEQQSLKAALAVLRYVVPLVGRELPAHEQSPFADEIAAAINSLTPIDD